MKSSIIEVKKNYSYIVRIVATAGMLKISTSGRFHCELVRILFLQVHRKTAFLQPQELSNQDQFRFRVTSINLNIDGDPRTLTHPTHKPLASSPLPSP